jgi:protoporphyrin/coproporphyrin ferrochelatase
LATRGILLLNLGSPSRPAVPEVRHYLGEFLMDPYVIDSPYLLRKLIVSAFILPFRPKQTAEAYASIWDSAGPGSPLLVHSVAQRDGLAERLDTPVALAMRYGEPRVRDALELLLAEAVDEVLLAPLYPHHADSTRRTGIEAVRTTLNRIAPHVDLQVLPPFYEEPRYIEVLADVCRAHLPADNQLLLFSYHGLPERHLTKADPTGKHCLQSENCCEVASAAHASCYRHQVRVTSQRVAAALGLTDDRWQLSFQSRLGRLPWLRPYTDQVLRELPGKGIKRLAVACPAFVADNLETLEEIGMQGRETFLEAGGESYTLIPCLNAEPAWLDLLADYCHNPLPESPVDQ